MPRARIVEEDGRASEWRSRALPRYQRLTRKAEALIASVYLSGTNTRRVKRALFGLFRGAVSKDVVSRGIEVAEFLEGHATLVDDRGRRRIVRNGHLPERLIQTGIGPVDVRQPRVRDRRAGEGAGAIRFTSAILPRYLRRTKSLEDLLPWLYLRGISSGDFSEAFGRRCWGAQAPGLSASTIGRLKEVWQDEMERWQRRDLSAKRYVYFWVDGIYFGARLEEEKQCILVIIGREVWQDEMERWQRRDLSAKRYVYFWVDGIYFGARLEEEKQCILVIIGRITEPRS